MRETVKLVYKEGILNLVSILYILVPIIVGIIIGLYVKKFTSNKIIYSIIISIVISIVYIKIISVYTSSQAEIQLTAILVVWNSILIFSSNMVIFIISYIMNIKKVK